MNASHDRIIVLDTETTGMNREGGAPYQGHRIIEIGAVEIINRRLTGRHFHVYIKPDREIDPEAINVHGITDAFISDKPVYAQIHQELLEFINGAELVAHNASFDVGFMNQELQMLDPSLGKIADFCKITDTLAMAKKLFPGKRNNLDILCDRYGIDNTHRTLHGALLDAEILADVYLLMTGGQTSLAFSPAMSDQEEGMGGLRRVDTGAKKLKIVYANADELKEHASKLESMAKKGSCLWR